MRGTSLWINQRHWMLQIISGRFTQTLVLLKLVEQRWCTRTREATSTRQILWWVNVRMSFGELAPAPDFMSGFSNVRLPYLLYARSFRRSSVEGKFKVIHNYVCWTEAGRVCDSTWLAWRRCWRVLHFIFVSQYEGPLPTLIHTVSGMVLYTITLNSSLPFQILSWLWPCLRLLTIDTPQEISHLSGRHGDKVSQRWSSTRLLREYLTCTLPRPTWPFSSVAREYHTIYAMRIWCWAKCI